MNKSNLAQVKSDSGKSMIFLKIAGHKKKKRCEDI